MRKPHHPYYGNEAVLLLFDDVASSDDDGVQVSLDMTEEDDEWMRPQTRVEWTGPGAGVIASRKELEGEANIQSLGAFTPASPSPTHLLPPGHPRTAHLPSAN